MKKCTLCGDSLPFGDFQRIASARDGLSSRCKACLRATKKADRERLKARTEEECAAAFAAAPPTKKCPVCKVELPKEDFARDRGKVTTVGQHCRPCAAMKVRQNRVTNPERARATARKSYKKNYQTHRKYWVKKKYDLSPEAYRALWEKQDGRCAICHQYPSGRTAELCVDHDHDTGEIRGLLCNNCNRGLGLFRDDPQILADAADYLAVAQLVSGLIPRQTN